MDMKRHIYIYIYIDRGFLVIFIICDFENP